MTELRNLEGPRKLDVLAALAEAYRGVWKNFGEMLQLIWLPGLIYVALSLVPSFIDAKEQVWVYSLAIMAGNLIWPIIAIAWHRFILLGDTAERSFQIRYGRRELRFLIVTFGLTLLFVPGLLLIGVMTAMTQGGTANPSSAATLLSVLSLILLLGGLYIFIRLTLLLPTVSVDAPLDVQTILERTRGNFWRLAALFLLTGLPMIIIGRLAMLAIERGLPEMIGHGINVLSLIFFAVLGVAVLSIAYRELIQSAEASH